MLAYGAKKPQITVTSSTLYNSMINSKTPPASGEFNLLGYMTILREIFMVPQTVSINSRFNEIQADLAKKSDEFEKRLATVENSFQSELQKMESSFHQQLTELRDNAEKTRSHDREKMVAPHSSLGNAIQ